MVVLTYKHMKKRVGGLPTIPQGPKVKGPREFELKHAALTTNTTRAHHINHHKKHAEANAHHVAIVRTQIRNTLVNEYNHILAASFHGPQK
ncbi:hypothetical protein N9L68_07565, partial [bacterium]|nr:hypothetical protein [bacterium]